MLRREAKDRLGGGLAPRASKETRWQKGGRRMLGKCSAWRLRRQRQLPLGRAVPQSETLGRAARLPGKA